MNNNRVYTITLMLTINTNKSPTNPVFQINDPDNITQDLIDLFDRRARLENALDFDNGGLFDRHPRFPNTRIVSPNTNPDSFFSDTEGPRFSQLAVNKEGPDDDPGKRGRRMHWHVALVMKVKGKIYPWGDDATKNKKDGIIGRSKYFDSLKSDVYQIFYDNGIITKDQYNERKGLYMNVRFRTEVLAIDYVKKNPGFMEGFI